MKKVLKWTVIVAGGLVTLLIVVSVILTKTGYVDQQMGSYQGKAKRASGKLLAASLYTSMRMQFIETNSYPDKAALLKDLSSYGPPNENWKIVLASENSAIQKLCPDCEIKKEAFKIALVGNIDDDADEDILTIDHEQNIMLVQDDLGEQQTPVLLLSKETRSQN